MNTTKTVKDGDHVIYINKIGVRYHAIACLGKGMSVAGYTIPENTPNIYVTFLEISINQDGSENKDIVSLPYVPHVSDTAPRGGWTEADNHMLSLGAVTSAIDAEPELPGKMPDEINALRRANRKSAENVLRSTVRATKRSIRTRIEDLCR